MVIAGREKTEMVNVPPAVLLCCTALCTMAQLENIAVSPLTESDLTGISTTKLNEPDEQNNRAEFLKDIVTTSVNLVYRLLIRRLLLLLSFFFAKSFHHLQGYLILPV